MSTTFSNYGSIPNHDNVSEWLRRWTRNPLGSAREGSNPFVVALLHDHAVTMLNKVSKVCKHLKEQCDLYEKNFLRFLLAKNLVESVKSCTWRQHLMNEAIMSSMLGQVVFHLIYKIQKGIRHFGRVVKASAC